MAEKSFNLHERATKGTDITAWKQRETQVVCTGRADCSLEVKIP